MILTHISFKLKTWKQNVQDKYRYVAQRRTILLEHVIEGESRNYWKYNPNIWVAYGDVVNKAVFGLNLLSQVYIYSFYLYK